jgi:hypothetical protein
MRIIEFAGRKWGVKSAINERVGPGPNYFSDAGVQVDDKGWLHLTISKDGDKWFCTEVISQERLGYGQYLFYVDGTAKPLDFYSTLGLFSYGGDQNEIDVEVANFGWRDCSREANKYLYYTIHLDREHQIGCTPLNLEGNKTSHKFVWSAAGVKFESYQGHYRCLPLGTTPILSKTYSGMKLPAPGNPLHLNFYLKGGNPPKNGENAEVVIRDVIFIEDGGGSNMGTLTNKAAVGDPWQKVSVAGFNSYCDAFQFVAANFDTSAVTPTFSAVLDRGEQASYSGNPWVVFYTSGPVLLSIIQCYAQLPNLNIGSWGNQCLLTS